MVVPALSNLQLQTYFQLSLLSLLSQAREATAGNTVRLRSQAKLLVEVACKFMQACYFG